MHDEDTPAGGAEMDPAVAVGQRELRAALMAAQRHLTLRGYGVTRMAMVLDGTLPDGDAFSGVEASTTEEPDEVAGLLAWAVAFLDGRLD
jgi:hypothetical protein